MHQDMRSFSLHFQTSGSLAHRCDTGAFLSYAGGKNDICTMVTIGMMFALAVDWLCAGRKIGPKEAICRRKPTKANENRIMRGTFGE